MVPPDKSTLTDRTLSQFKRAHVLETVDGLKINLDLNVSAATDEELIQAMSAVTTKLDQAQALPCAPKELWERFVALVDDTGQNRRLFSILALPGMKRRKLSFVVLRDHA